MKPHNEDETADSCSFVTRDRQLMHKSSVINFVNRMSQYTLSLGVSFCRRVAAALFAVLVCRACDGSSLARSEAGWLLRADRRSLSKFGRTLGGSQRLAVVSRIGSIICHKMCKKIPIIYLCITCTWENILLIRNLCETLEG